MLAYRQIKLKFCKLTGITCADVAGVEGCSRLWRHELGLGRGSALSAGKSGKGRRDQNGGNHLEERL